MAWTNAHQLGLIPEILFPGHKAPVKDQLNERYAHGGGYCPFPNEKDFRLNPNRLRPGQATLSYVDPDEPGYVETFREWGRCWFPHTRELAILFDSAVLAIVQADESFNITRVD